MQEYIIADTNTNNIDINASTRCFHIYNNDKEKYNNNVHLIMKNSHQEKLN